MALNQHQASMNRMAVHGDTAWCSAINIWITTRLARHCFVIQDALERGVYLEVINRQSNIPHLGANAEMHSCFLVFILCLAVTSQD